MRRKVCASYAGLNRRETLYKNTEKARGHGRFLVPFSKRAQKALISREKRASIKEKYEPAGGLRDAERSLLGTGALQAEVCAAALHARGHPAYGRSVNTKAMVYLHRGFFISHGAWRKLPGSMERKRYHEKSCHHHGVRL